MSEQRFFDKYNRFYETSSTGTKPERLDHRYRAIIQHNSELFADARILDLASHDGRWSFAALKNGASYVKGIEGNENLVKAAYENMKHYEIPRESYDFVQGDLHQLIRDIEPGSFDGLFCLGFLAHTPHHMFLIDEFERINPEFMVLDLRVLSVDRNIIAYKTQPTEREYTAIGGKDEAWVGVMSRSLLESALEKAGFGFEVFDFSSDDAPWKKGRGESRITVTAFRMDQTGKTPR